MDCYNCKAKSHCEAVVQSGSVMCTLYRLRYCGTKMDEPAKKQPGDFCQYCGHRLRVIGSERFCNNVNCTNRFENV